MSRTVGTLDAAGPTGAETGRYRFAALLVAVALVAAVAASLGIGVRAIEQAEAAVDEPQYLLSALSLAEDGDLNIADELADGRASGYHRSPLPVQTEVRADGSQVSPHDPLLPLLLAPAVGLGGWVGGKLLLAATAAVLAALTLWVAVRRFAVPATLAAVVVAVASASVPLAVYGHQVYPEVPAALAVMVAVAALTGPLRRGGLTAWVLAVVALPWLSVKYAPVAAVLAVAGLWLLWRSRRAALSLAVVAVLAAAGAVFLAVHRVVYGGWTAYASGDHFQATGEFAVSGVSPNYAGRSTRLAGLLVDQDFGLAAWQPAWLLAVAAVAALVRLRPRGWALLVVPLLAGWLVATFVALTMHGFWFPGRQIVVVAPLAVVAVCVWLAAVPWRTGWWSITAVMGAVGVAVYGWLIVAGRAGTLDWVGAPDVTPPAPLAALRSVLPDYRVLDGTDWALHGVWALVLVALAVAGHRSVRTVVGARAATAADTGASADGGQPTSPSLVFTTKGEM
jgi:hypothetical protein